MNVIKGIATKVRNATEISGGGDSSVTTTHVSIFLLDKQQVQIKSSHPLIVEENDEILVSGELKDGLLRGYAYKNCTTSVSGNSGFLPSFFFGVIMPLAGLCVFIGFSDPFFGILPKIIGSVFMLAGCFCIYSGMRVVNAKNLLDDYILQQSGHPEVEG